MSAAEDYTIEETPEEARLNRGFITVMEQTKDTENHDVGDRFVYLGKQPKLFKVVNKGTPDQGFVPQAVPLAHIELPVVLDDADDLSDWLTSDLGKLALQPFFEEVDAPESILTEWGKEREFDV